MALLIPILAIAGNFVIKIIRLRTEAGVSGDTRKLLEKIERDNIDLRERVENLETIITSLDKELLALQPTRLSNLQIQKQVEELAKKLEN